MARIGVFLVDDHPVVREGMRRLLEMDERVSVVGEVGSAEEALEQVEVSRADVVLIDIRLPGMDGVEATRRLRARYPHLKLVVLSSFGEEYLTEAIEAGANGYILKTASQPEVLQAVVQAAAGQYPVDPRLTTSLLHQIAEAPRVARRQTLSERQREILRLIADGVPSKGIEERLAIGSATLTRELRHVFDLLGVDDRAHAMAEAFRRKLL